MKRLLALLTVAVLLVSFLSSCSSTSSSSSTGTTTAGSTTVAMGTLKIGVDDTYPPMEYTDDAGGTIGFDVDMAKEIAKRMKMKSEFVSTAWDGIFNALNTEKFDCIISSVSMTTERLKNFTFTKPYIANSQMIVVAPGDNSITKPEDLKGKIVGCQISTTANESADKLQKSGVKFKELKTYDQILNHSLI